MMKSANTRLITFLRICTKNRIRDLSYNVSDAKRSNFQPQYLISAEDKGPTATQYWSLCAFELPKQA
jgi:hypothetical protein